MTAGRLKRADELAEAALKRRPDERSGFLDEACAGDQELRREVETLLACDLRVSNFLVEPAVHRAAALLEQNRAEPMIGRRIGRYEIIDEIGQGGMGEVYLAQDSKLDRKVAIKFLPSDSMADEQAKRRLVREAKAAAKLDHPNICSVYEVSDEEERGFIVMQYVEGETLASRIQRKPIELKEALNIALQAADALSEAHARGIIHRDVKPANMIITSRGQVKVLDFGLAKLTERMSTESVDTRATTSLKTDPGIVLGTAAYMSPEQTRGQELDARTDIFSLGVVFYELVAGRLPFEGKDVHRQIIAIQENDPPPLSTFAEGVPARLEEIVEKALAKDPDERYQTAKDLLIDLRNLKKKLEFDAEIERTNPPELKSKTSSAQSQPATASQSLPLTATLSEIKRHRTGASVALLTLVLAIGAASYFFYARGKTAIDCIAVLPFVNVSREANAEYLSDGITESIISSLSQLPQLKVMARSTVFRYKDRETDPQQAGRELSVRAVLNGRVLQQGDSLVIRTELVNVADGTQLWGAEYNRKLSDLITIQQEISREISEKLRLRLTGAEQQQLTKRYTDDTEAYQLYLKGRYYWNKRTPADLKASVEYFRQAIVKDPNYALAYTGLADTYNVFPTFGMVKPKEAYPEAKGAAQEALEIDDSLAEAHTALAVVLAIYDWNWSTAEREFKRAIELNPNYATAHYFYAFFYLTPMGRLTQALAEMKRAQELEPRSLVINTNVGATLIALRQYDEAVAQLQQVLDSDANFKLAHSRLSNAYVFTGRYEEAIAESKKSLQGSPYTFWSFPLAIAYARSGNESAAKELLKELEARPPGSYCSPTFIAWVCAALGERDRAFKWLETGYEERDWNLSRNKVEPYADGLRSDPRFADLLGRMGLPQ